MENIFIIYYQQNCSVISKERLTIRTSDNTSLSCKKQHQYKKYFCTKIHTQNRSPSLPYSYFYFFYTLTFTINDQTSKTSDRIIRRHQHRVRERFFCRGGLLKCFNNAKKSFYRQGLSFVPRRPMDGTEWIETFRRRTFDL